MTPTSKILAQHIDVMLEDARRKAFDDGVQDRRMTVDTTVSQVIAGRYEIEHPEGHYFVEPGEVYLHQANIPVAITHHFGSCGRMESHWVRFHSTIYKTHDAVSLFDMPLKVEGDVAREIGQTIEELVDVTNCAPAGSEGEFGRLMQDTYRVPMLLARIMQAIVEVSTPRPGAFALLEHANRMSPVLQYIHHHLAESIRVEDLADIACLSESHFHTTFKQAFGDSPIQYIRALRIREACRLLMGTHRQVQEIAEITGFGNAYYFCRAFKAQLNVSPSQYRKINASMLT